MTSSWLTISSANYMWKKDLIVWRKQIFNVEGSKFIYLKKYIIERPEWSCVNTQIYKRFINIYKNTPSLRQFQSTAHSAFMLLHKTSTGNTVHLTSEFDYIFGTGREQNASDRRWNVDLYFIWLLLKMLNVDSTMSDPATFHSLHYKIPPVMNRRIYSLQVQISQHI